MDMGYVEALVRERAGYAQTNPSRVIAVDEELVRLGWCVDSATGGLVRVDANRRAAAPVTPPAVTIADVEAELDEAERQAAEAEPGVERPARGKRERRPLKAPERVVED